MAMEFTDVNGQHVRDGDAGANYLNGLSAVSVCIWVKSDVTGTDDGFIVSEANIDDDCIECRYDSSGFSGGGNNVIKTGFRLSSGGKTQYESASNVQTTNWQHIVYGWPNASNQLWMYLDGVIDTPTHQGSGTGTLTGITSLLVGRGGKNTSSGGSWNGLVDDFRIYNRILSASEIQTIYAARGRDTVFDGLLVRWLFDADSPGQAASGIDQVRDRGNGAHHGTPSNSPVFQPGIVVPRRRRAK